MMSPCGMARAMTPRRLMASAMRGTTLSPGSKASRVSRFFTSSTALSIPSPRTSPHMGMLAQRLAEGPRQIWADLARVGDKAQAVQKLEVGHAGPQRRMGWAE